MRTLLYLFILLIPTFACSRKVATETYNKSSVDSPIVKVGSSDAQRIPVCIAKKIDSIKQDHVWNPPAEIHEYEIDGRKVYAISADCCDRFSTVIDADCAYVCAPSGGFTGRGDGKCRDFFQQAKHLRLVWKDERTKK